MGDFKTLNGYNVKDETAREQIDILNSNIIVAREQIDILNSNIIVFVGDSYMCGVGGTANKIPDTIATYYNCSYKNYSTGGEGFVRKNSSGEDILTHLETANNDESLTNEMVKEIVISGGYNDLGLIGTEDWSEETFVQRLKEISLFCKQNFVNANVTVICFPWINIACNGDFFKLQNWLENACDKAGLKHSHNAIRWLQYLDANVQSGDGVHPSDNGYELIATNILSIMRGGIVEIERKATVTTLWGNLDVVWNGKNVVITGQLNVSDLTNTVIGTLPTNFPPLMNRFAILSKYGNYRTEHPNTQLMWFFDRNIMVAADQYTQGDIYFINSIIPE